MYYCRLILLFFIAFLSGMSRCEADIFFDVLHKSYNQNGNSMFIYKEDSNLFYIDKTFLWDRDGKIPRTVTCNENITSCSDFINKKREWQDEESAFNSLYNMQDSALSYYCDMLDSIFYHNNPCRLVCLNLHLAVLYFKVKRYDEAEKYIDMALNYISSQSDIYMVMMVWQVRAAIKSRIGKWDDSFRSVRSAWQIATGKCGNRDWQLLCIPSFIYYFFETNQSDSVDFYLDKGNSLCSEMSFQDNRCIAVAGFIQARSLINYERGKYRDALIDLLSLNQLQANVDKKWLYRTIAGCYHGLGQNDRAYIYMDSACLYTDLLTRKEVDYQLAKFNVKYSIQQKNLQISGLRQEVLEKRVDFFEISFLLICTLIIVAVFVWRQKYKQKLVCRRIQQLKQEKELEATRRYIDGLEEECRYFAKELHDGIANDLLALQMKADMEGNQEWALAVGKLLGNIRAISHELMPPEFENLNLDQILRYYVQMLTKNTHVEVTYSGLSIEDGNVYPVPQRVSYELYRVTQEVLMNILKYAEATRVSVCMSLDHDSLCCLRITDNGEKTPVVCSEGMTGIGLRTVAHRAKSIQAQVETRYERKNNEFKLSFKLKDAE